MGASVSAESTKRGSEAVAERERAAASQRVSPTSTPRRFSAAASASVTASSHTPRCRSPARPTPQALTSPAGHDSSATRSTGCASAAVPAREAPGGRGWRGAAPTAPVATQLPCEPLRATSTSSPSPIPGLPSPGCRPDRARSPCPGCPGPSSATACAGTHRCSPVTSGVNSRTTAAKPRPRCSSPATTISPQSSRPALQPATCAAGRPIPGPHAPRCRPLQLSLPASPSCCS